MLSNNENLLRGKTIANVKADVHRLELEFKDGSGMIIQSDIWKDAPLGHGLIILACSDLAKDVRNAPNDPKLSDSGVRRGTCMVGGKAAVEAGAVTHGAVRCSAWLGSLRILENSRDIGVV